MFQFGCKSSLVLHLVIRLARIDTDARERYIEIVRRGNTKGTDTLCPQWTAVASIRVPRLGAETRGASGRETTANEQREIKSRRETVKAQLRGQNDEKGSNK